MRFFDTLKSMSPFRASSNHSTPASSERPPAAFPAQIGAPPADSSPSSAGTHAIAPVPFSPQAPVSELPAAASINLTATKQIAPKPSPQSTLPPKPEFPQLSPATEAILLRTKAAQASRSGETGWAAAREQVLQTLVTSDKLVAQPLTPLPSARGRGRPRGRKQTNGTPPSSSAKLSANTTPTHNVVNEQSGTRSGGRGRGRGRGRWRGGGKGGKRRRDDDDDEGEEESEQDESDGSSNYTPIATETKYGRKVNKPTQFVPAIPSPSSAPKRRKVTIIPRKNESSICKICHRGNSPNTNMIVYCDGCNTPYHQYCHDPPIDKEVVQVPDMEWFCKECKKAQELAMYGMEGLVPGPDLLPEEKEAYFGTLPSSHLISLLCYVSAVYPHLPLFHADTQARLEAIGVSTVGSISNRTKQTVTTPTGLRSNPVASPQLLSQGTHGDDQLADPTAVTFPRPGNGLAARAMRPESEDLQWLVDDNLEVFSHIYQKDNNDDDGLSTVPTGTADDTVGGAAPGVGVSGVSDEHGQMSNACQQI